MLSFIEQPGYYSWFLTCLLVTAAAYWLNSWLRASSTAPYWHVIEQRACAAACSPICDGLPRGWTRCSFLGLTIYYYDILNAQRVWKRPADRPLYTPLILQQVTPDTRSIRLLVIVPGQPETAVEGLLFNISMRVWMRISEKTAPDWRTRILGSIWPSTPIHIARTKSEIGNILSYCWGEPEITNVIKVNGHTLNVTTNLANALRALRRIKRPFMLWVDAVCVNQQDKDEKQAVIPAMGNLYRSAKTVHCWLGSLPAQHRDRFFAIVARLASDPQARLARDMYKAVMDETYPVEELQADRDCYEKIAGLPNWSRKWILQEIVLARRLRVHSDERSVVTADPTILTRALEQLYYGLHTVSFHASGRYRSVYQNPLNYSTAAFEGFKAGRELYDLNDFDRLPGLINTLAALHTREKEDAVLAMLSLLRRFEIRTDASQSSEDVFRVATTRLLVVSRSLQMLKRARCKGTPSWIIDFSKPFPMARYIQCNALTRVVNPRFSIHKNILQVMAYQLGTVRAVCRAPEGTDEWKEGEPPKHDFAWTRERLRAWRSFFDQYDPDPHHVFQWSFFSQDLAWSMDNFKPHWRPVSEAELTIRQERIQDFMTGNDTAYSEDWGAHINRKTVFVTQEGIFGMTSSFSPVTAGDKIIAIESLNAPFCARRVSKEVLCNHCGSEVQDVFRRCRRCHDGYFMICPACFSKGCLDVHALEEYILRDGDVEVVVTHNQSGVDLLSMPLLSLHGTCYLQGAWDEAPIRTAAKKRFGDESRIDDAFETITLI